MVNALSAANAYKTQLKVMQDATSNPLAEETQSGFAKMVENALNGATDTVYKSEATQMSALTGKADLVDLVTAINSAELTLNTIVTIRDKAISAYQDIIRMPI